MSEFANAILPAIVIGVALQRFLQIISPALYLLLDKSRKLKALRNSQLVESITVFISKFQPVLFTKDNDQNGAKKNTEVWHNLFLGLISIIIAMWVVISIEEVRIFKYLNIEFEDFRLCYFTFDAWLTGLIISAGTEGFKSIFEFTKKS